MMRGQAGDSGKSGELNTQMGLSARTTEAERFYAQSVQTDGSRSAQADSTPTTASPALSPETLANIERGIEQFKRGEGTIINFDEEEGELAVNQPDGEATLKSSNLGSPSPALMSRSQRLWLTLIVLRVRISDWRVGRRHWLGQGLFLSVWKWRFWFILRPQIPLSPEFHRRAEDAWGTIA